MAAQPDIFLISIGGRNFSSAYVCDFFSWPIDMNLGVIKSGARHRQKWYKVRMRSRTVSIRLSPRSHSSASPSLPEATNLFHSARHDCILDLIFLFSATFEIQFKYTSSSSGTKNDDSRDSTVSKLADSAVMRSLTAFNVLVRLIEMEHTYLDEPI